MRYGKVSKLIILLTLILLCGCREVVNYSIPFSNEIVFAIWGKLGHKKFGYEIWTMDANGGNKQLLLKNKHYIGGWVSWSPDGKKIAVVHFSKKRSPGFFELKIIDLAEKKMINGLLKKEGVISDFTWHPNGREIVFATKGEIYSFDIALKALKKVVDKHLTKGKNIYWPDLSPDGDKITFEVFDKIVEWGGEGHKVYIMDIKEKRITRLTNNCLEVSETKPAWSPNNNWIAFDELDKTEHYPHIVLINPQTMQQYEIRLPHSTEFAIDTINFSPDSKKIILGTIGGEIYSIDINGKNLKNLTNTSDCYEASPSWRPIVKNK